MYKMSAECMKWSAMKALQQKGNARVLGQVLQQMSAVIYWQKEVKPSRIAGQKQQACFRVCCGQVYR